MKEECGTVQDERDGWDDRRESLEELLDDEAFTLALINALNQNFVLEVEASLRARPSH